MSDGVTVGVIADVHNNASPSGGEPISIIWPGDQRWFSNAPARMAAFATEMESQSADLCIDLGDIVDATTDDGDAADDLAEIVAALTGNYSGDCHYILGNHEYGIWRTDWTDYEAVVTQTPPGLVDSWSTGQPAGWPVTTAYSWDKSGIHFVALYRQFSGDDKDALCAWLAADMAATELPIVVLSHYHLDDAYRFSAAGAYRNVIDAYNVQAVIAGHMHQVPRLCDFITYPGAVGMDTPYYHLRGNLIGPLDGSTPDTTLGKDAACYLFDIRPNAVAGANHPRAQIDVTCYYTAVEGEGNNDSMDRETHYIAA